MKHIKIKELFVLTAILLSGFFAFPGTGFAASLYFFPEAATKSAGSNFTVSLYVNSTEQAMNAVSGVVSFPPEKLQVVSISKSNSIVSLWVQEPTFSNQDGRIRFEGVALNPGYTGATGRVISITFRPRTSGTAALKFESGSVLANDGQGTNILETMGGGNYILQADAPAGFPETTETKTAQTAPKTLPDAPLIKSTTHIFEDQWYNVKNLELSWDIPAGVDGVSYALEANPNFTLVPQGKGLISNVSYNIANFTDGVWYFHLRFHTAAGWGPVSKRMIKIDFNPPAPPTLSRLDMEDKTNPEPLYSWKSSDTASGLRNYSVKIGTNDWFDVPLLGTDEAMRMPRQAPGEYQMTVRAYDEAGNYSDGGTVLAVMPIGTPRITSYSQNITSSFDPLTVEGEANKGETITVFLRKGEIEKQFTASVAEDGTWSVETKETFPSGMWDISARATDSRGALSLETTKLPVEILSPWVRVARFLAKTIMIFGALILVLGAFLALAYFTFGRSMLYRLRLRREFFEFKAKVRDELKAIEGNLDSLKKSGKIDPSTPEFEDTEKRVKGQLTRLVEDIRYERKLIDEA